MGNRFIDKLQGFFPLAEEDVSALSVATSHPQKVPPRRDIIREGDRPGPVFVILEGWACRYKILPNGTRQIVAYLMPGDACDMHVGLLAEMDHSIQTITSAVIATIDRAKMDELLDRHPNFAKAMYVAQLDVRALPQGAQHRADDRTAPIPAAFAGFAGGFAGHDTVHLNRVLKELRQSGAMTLARGSLTIVDPGALVRVAGFDESYLHRRLRRAA